MKYFLLLLLLSGCGQNTNERKSKYHPGEVVYVKPDSLLGVVSAHFAYDSNYIKVTQKNGAMDERVYNDCEVFGKK